jgi:molybdopterin converting factor small subunit
MTAEITVAVRLGGRLGADRLTMRLPAGATVADLQAALAARTGRGEREFAAAAISLAGSLVGRAHVLRDGDGIALILPVAGG